jgi:hypothetical protein
MNIFKRLAGYFSIDFDFSLSEGDIEQLPAYGELKNGVYTAQQKPFAESKKYKILTS